MEAQDTNVTKEVAEALRSFTSELFKETRELIDATEERLGLNEAKLGYGLNHYERETRLARSSLPRLYIALFFYSRVPGEEPSEACAGYLNLAEEISRDQLAHWRNVSHYQYIALEAVAIANIAQYRIECRIIKEPTLLDQTLEDALELLEEVELLFGTTLHEVDLSHSLVTLTMKVQLGNKMGIWTVGKTATRLLLQATQMIQEKTQGNDSEKAKAEHEKRVLRLWQWVQRVKARALAQSMGLDNVVPDSMLVEIQNSINNDTVLAEKEVDIQSDHTGSGDEAEFAERFEAVKLDATSTAPLELLPEVRQFLKESNCAVPKLDIDRGTQERCLQSKQCSREMTSNSVLEDIFSLSQDLQSANVTSEKLKRMDDGENENKKAVQEELAFLVERISTKPGLHKLLTIASLLNREEALLNSIKNGPPRDRYERRVNLQRFRQEMRCEPLLRQMLRIREGWPFSNKDLHKIATDRNGKAVFIDWFSVTSSFNQIEKLYMLVWRNGICKLIDLNTEMKSPRQAVTNFFNDKDKDIYLPGVRMTPLKDMDLENLVPKNVFADKPRPVKNCMELIKPLFDDPLMEDEDLLVLSVTEGFQNFPLHAVEDGKNGPLILHHSLVYVPSLSVLHKCYWTRHISSKVPKDGGDETLRSLVLGGIVSTKDSYQYGGKAVERIGNIVHSPETFVGPAATLDNFRTHVSTSDLLHIHLHTNYGMKKASKGQVQRSESAKEGISFITSPLDQALVFNDSDQSNNQLTARQIIEINSAKGAHLNLIGCASGRQGKFDAGFKSEENIVTDEVMGLVPAFLFSGMGSVTSTLWPTQDEHGAVFSHIFFQELMGAKAAVRCSRKENVLSSVGGNYPANWVDLAEVHRKAVLEMRRIYKQPYAWAGFILSGFWKFEVPY
jgi:CHAT domain-containing protein